MRLSNYVDATMNSTKKISIKTTIATIVLVALEPLPKGRVVWRSPFGEMAWVGVTLGFD